MQWPTCLSKTRVDAAEPHNDLHWVCCPASLAEGLPHKRSRKLHRVIQWHALSLFEKCWQFMKNSPRFISKCFAVKFSHVASLISSKLQKADSLRAVLRPVLVPSLPLKLSRPHTNSLTCPSSSFQICSFSCVLCLSASHGLPPTHPALKPQHVSNLFFFWLSQHLPFQF